MSDRISRLSVGAGILMIVLATGLVAAQDEKADATQATPRPLTIDDYFKIHEVGDPQVSPDGKWVAYTVTKQDLEKDESKTRIWMAPTAGGDPVPMTAKDKSASRPRWSPDGRYLAFLAAPEDGEDQIWTLFREGGDSQPLTETVQGVSSYEWSPDGKRMVLVLQDPKPEDIEKAKDENGKEKTPRPWVVTRRQFKQDYVGYLDSRRTHLFVLDVGTKKMTQITSGDFDDSEPFWSPDGRHIAFTSNRTDDPDSNYNTDIWVVTADNTDKGQTLTQITTNPGPDTSPAWSPDGKRIAHISATDTEAILYATNHLAISSAQGGGLEVLTGDLDRMVFTPRFSVDGKSILFALEDSGELSLARIAPGGGAVERVISGPRSVATFSEGARGLIAALISEPHLPPEVFIIDEGELRRLTRTNDALLEDLLLGEVEKVQFDSRDGTEIEGFIVKPPAFDSKVRYPTILRIHGGPQSQYDFAFHFEAQLLAANGYVVVMPNPRGSTGYGQDFCLAIWQDWGGIDLEDVLASVDDAIERGYADPDRLGVGGWSYGGMMTNHVITKSKRFKGAYTGASATLYVVNYGHDQYQRWWETELGLPWRNREIWEELSPFNRVEDVVTPTLIVGGEQDWNVPIINSEQLYIALKRLGVATELVVYPGEGHVFETPSYNKDLYERFLGWFGKYVKGEPVQGSDTE
ncbi:MAG: S9 family peptidase [Acidobacteriota bacterium]|jgi:dipeptidyl aminopeptidase/acylaminoacyl peptidase|nr:S9 family peptidase [Acidobacteriota bacterium]